MIASRNRILPVVAILALAGSLGAQEPAPETKKNEERTVAKSPCGLVPATRLVGKNVEDAQGSKIAEIEDFLVTDDGDVVAVLDRSGGGLACLPLEKLDARVEIDEDAKTTTPAPPVAARDIEAFQVEGGSQAVLAAPAVKDVSALTNDDLKRACEGKAAKADDSPTPLTDAAQEPTRPKTPAASVAHDDKPLCLEKVRGMDVKDASGETIGEVADLAIDIEEGEVAYAVIEVGGVLGLGEKRHAIALDDLECTADGKAFTISMAKDRIGSMPGIDMDRLPARPDLTPDMTGATPRPADASGSGAGG